MGKILLKYILRIEWEYADGIYVAQDSDKSRTLVDMITNLRVTQTVGKFLV